MITQEQQKTKSKFRLKEIHNNDDDDEITACESNEMVNTIFFFFSSMHSIHLGVYTFWYRN